MKTTKWYLKRYYFLTSFSLIILATAFMGSYQVISEYREYRETALKDKNSSISYKKEILKTRIDSFINSVIVDIENSERMIMHRLKTLVSDSNDVAEGIMLSMKGKHRPAEIMKTVKAALSNVGYGDNYLFIFDDNANVVSSHFKHMEGVNFSDKLGADGSNIYKDTMNAIDGKDEAFVETYWQQPGGGSEPRKKIIYIKRLKGTNWILGCGEYTDTFENNLKQAVIERAESINFNKKNYIFISGWDGTTLAGPGKNKNMLHIRDSNGKYIVKEMIAASRRGGGFVEYVMPPFKDMKAENKLSYVSGISKWQWYIGTGIYLTDIEATYESKIANLYKNMRKDIVFISTIGILVMVVAGVLIIILSKKFQRMIGEYEMEISSKNDALEEMNASLGEMVLDKTSELNELNHSLEMKIAARTAENREKDRVMFQQGRHAAMGEMIGNIAHQWRQPLNSISLIIQDIKDAYDFDELDGEYLTDNVERCTKTIAHMSDTIDNFRYFFNPDKESVEFNIDDEIRRGLDLVDAVFANYGVLVSTELDSSVKVMGIPGEYSQVIVSILNNARDALLGRDIENPELIVKSFFDGKFAVVEMEDNGGGVPSQHIDKIFEPYFTTKPKSKGTGIGLYFSKIIIEKNMSGKISVKNTERGAKFIVAVPGIILEDPHSP